MDGKEPEKESGYTNILLEEMRSNFKMFGESLDMFREDTKQNFKRLEKKIDINFNEIGSIKIDIVEMKGDIVEIKKDIVEIRGDIVEIKEDIVEIRGDIVEMKGDIKEINGRLDNIETEIKSLRKDFDLMREELKDKVSMSYFQKFEERLIRVEKKLELSSV